METKRISPAEAKALLDEGYVYVDVRSIPEFDAGHPTGAFNVPLNHQGPRGMQPNPDFVAVMEANFPKDAKLVLGCKAGGRSAKAAAVLAQAGFTNLVDQRCGWSGAPDAFGKVEPGWQPAGLPSSLVAEAGRSYADLAKKAGVAG